MPASSSPTTNQVRSVTNTHNSSISKPQMANCGNCRVCRRVDCGNCKTCKNKVKFGGPGTWKQTCLLLQNKGCLNRSSDDITVISNPSTPKNTNNTITNQKNSVRTPQQNASSFSSNNKPTTPQNGNGNANNQKNSVKPSSSQAPTTPEKVFDEKTGRFIQPPKIADNTKPLWPDSDGEDDVTVVAKPQDENSNPKSSNMMFDEKTGRFIQKPEWSPIQKAAFEGNAEKVQKEIDDSEIGIMCPVPDGCLLSGWTPLHIAVLKGHSKVVEILAPLTDPDVPTPCKWTPLQLAAHYK